jgi:hypothetical protein
LHTTDKFDLPANTRLIPLPPRPPELKPVVNVCQNMLENWLSNRIFSAQDQNLATCYEV